MGGAWRGRRLKAPRSKSVRPSAGRVKESLFSIIESRRMKLGLAKEFDGLDGLDLYAGAGGLGFEFLSRGGSSIVFVEQARESLRCIRENADLLSAISQTNIIAGTVLNTIRLWASPNAYDVVFMDPPYNIAELNQVLSLCADRDILKPGGILVLEHDPKQKILIPSSYELIVEKQIGPAGIHVFRKESG